MSGGSVPKSFACATAVTILAGCLALGIIQGLVHGAGYTDANSNLRGGAGVPENQPASAAVAVTNGGYQLPDAASVEVGIHAARAAMESKEAESWPLDQGKPYDVLLWPVDKQKPGFYDDWGAEEEEKTGLKESSMASRGLHEGQEVADMDGLMKAYSYKFEDFMDIEDHISDAWGPMDGFMEFSPGLLEKQEAADMDGLMKAYSYKFDDFMNIEDHVSHAWGPMDGLMEFSYAL